MIAQYVSPPLAYSPPVFLHGATAQSEVLWETVLSSVLFDPRPKEATEKVKKLTVARPSSHHIWPFSLSSPLPSHLRVVPLHFFFPEIQKLRLELTGFPLIPWQLPLKFRIVTM